MKRVVLTGGTGFIGSNLARRLVEEGHEVHLLLRKKYNPWRIDPIKGDVHLHVVDLTDAESLAAEVVSIRPDWIFHLAVYGAYQSQSGLRRMVDTNLMATANLVDACAQVGFEAFINTGSSSEYGYKNHAPTEEEWLEPNSMYAITKAAATHYCRWIAQSQRMNLATLRLYSAFGPLEEPTRLIPALILDGLQGNLPPLVDPSVARDYIFIDDVVDAYLAAASHPGSISARVYNVGTGVQTSLREVVDLACQLLPISVKPHWGSMPNRQWDTSVWMADHTNIARDLGWKPKIIFSVGLKRTIEWFKSNPDLINFYRTKREAQR
jgi:nucleoside-diphosphate-sugar epimerase